MAYNDCVRMKPSGNFASRIKFDGKEKALGTTFKIEFPLRKEQKI